MSPRPMRADRHQPRQAVADFCSAVTTPRLTVIHQPTLLTRGSQVDAYPDPRGQVDTQDERNAVGLLTVERGQGSLAWGGMDALPHRR